MNFANRMELIINSGNIHIFRLLLNIIEKDFMFFEIKGINVKGVNYIDSYFVD